MPTPVGPKDPATQQTTSTGGFPAWTNNTSGLKTDGDSTTSSVMIDDGTVLGAASRTLSVSNFSMGTPSGATVNGNVVEIDNTTVTTVPEQWVTMTKTAATSVGTTKVATPTSTGFKTYGTSSDLWGTTWTQAETVATGYGSRLQAQNGVVTTSTMTCDNQRMTVYYTAAVTGGPAPHYIRRSMMGGMSGVSMSPEFPLYRIADGGQWAQSSMKNLVGGPLRLHEGIEGMTEWFMVKLRGLSWWKRNLSLNNPFRITRGWNELLVIPRLRVIRVNRELV